MPTLYPLRFRPIFRRYIWGGRRLETLLGKPLGPGNDYAESWEIADHGPDQSVVESGPLAGASLHQLVAERGAEVLGQHHPQTRFPLLVKYLDARDRLSVQVHPNDTQAARLDPPDLGKSEAWVVLAAESDSTIWAGLRPGVDRMRLAKAVRDGRCEECLHSLRPTPGDCVFLPAGTVHALGSGLLVAEIQQSSDVTYRLYDWNRVGPDGKPRALHVERALEVIDYGRGPLEPQTPRPISGGLGARLVQCDKFILDRWELDGAQPFGGDQRCHVLSILEGSVRVAGDVWESPLSGGGTILLPAALGEVLVVPHGRAVLLDAFLP